MHFDSLMSNLYENHILREKVFKIQNLYLEVQLFRKTYKDVEPSYNFDFLQRKIQNNSKTVILCLFFRLFMHMEDRVSLKARSESV